MSVRQREKGACDKNRVDAYRRHKSLWSRPHSVSVRRCSLKPAHSKNASGVASLCAGNPVITRKKAYMVHSISRPRMRCNPRAGIWKSAINQFAFGVAQAANRGMICPNWSGRKQSRKKCVTIRS